MEECGLSGSMRVSRVSSSGRRITGRRMGCMSSPIASSMLRAAGPGAVAAWRNRGGRCGGWVRGKTSVCFARAVLPEMLAATLRPACVCSFRNVQEQRLHMPSQAKSSRRVLVGKQQTRGSPCREALPAVGDLVVLCKLLQQQQVVLRDGGRAQHRQQGQHGVRTQQHKKYIVSGMH